MAVVTKTVTVANGEAKSGFIRTEDYVQAGGKRCTLSLVTPSTLDGTTTTVKWYGSLFDQSGKEFPLIDDNGAIENGNLAASSGIEVPIESPYRWPYLLFELTDGSSADNQAAAREFTVVGVDI